MKRKGNKEPGTKQRPRSGSAPKNIARSRGLSLQRKRWVTPSICLSLVVITWIVFGRTVGFDFLNYDDSFYVYQNPIIKNGLTRAGFVAAFTQSLVGNWHPLTSTSLMLDAQLFGLNAGGYHFVNVLLHTIAVLLLFLVLKAMTGPTWRSAFVAVLFAVHPLRAESVVWISERKDVLSGIFFLLTLGAYLRYARQRRLSAYLIVAAALTLGLLSKAMLVTVPFVLLLLDYWPLRRSTFLQAKTSGDATVIPPAGTTWLILEKLPLLALAAAVSIATVIAQKPALESAAYLSLSWRIQNALVAIWVYLRQMILPSDLAIFYPHLKGSLPLLEVGLALVLLLVTSAAVLAGRKRYPYLVTGWFWYLGMLVPVIGVVQVGWQAHADRYTYLPQIGIYLMISWGVADLSAGWRWRQPILTGAATLVVVALMMLAWRQVDYWSSSAVLWRHTLAVTTNNDVAERGLGTALIKLGQVDEAIAHDRAALRIRPGDTNGLTNLANALLQKDELPEAIEHFREVARLRPNDNEARRNLGKALFRSGAIDESVAEFREALRIRPTDSDVAYSLGNALLQKGEASAAIPYFRKAIESDRNNIAAHYNLAIALQHDGQLDAAIAEFRKTLNLDPRKVDARNNLAITLLKKNLTKEAIAEWQAALRVQPGNAEVHNNLAVAFLGQGRIAEAIAEWRETLRLQPDKVSTEISLAWILSTAPEDTLRDGGRALELAKHAFQTSVGRNLMTYRVFAAAYAETGQFQAAINAAQEGAQRADAAGQSSTAQLLQLDLSLYQQGIPLRDSSHGRGGAPPP
jgi:tetratricopeptide (TPR) repeat protein